MTDSWRPRQEGTVRLRDGRLLGYGEWGDPAGKPVLFFPGGWMSRLASVGWSAAAELGVRLLSVESPGHGVSDPNPGWRLLDRADDTADLADQLGIDRFAVAGFSAGGPPALACGYALPDRVAVVGMVATIVDPLRYEPDEIARLAWSDPVAAEAFAREHCAAMAEDIEASVAEMANKPGPDGAVYAQPEIQELFVANRREAFRQGVDGPAYAIVEINLPWQFAFEDVGVPVHYWLGDEDHATSPALVDTAVGHLPNYTVTIYPGEGHAIMFTHGDEILAELAASLD